MTIGSPRREGAWVHSLILLGVGLLGGLFWSAIAYVLVGLFIAIIGESCGTGPLVCSETVRWILMVGPLAATAVLSVLAGVAVVLNRPGAARPRHVWPGVVWGGWAAAVTVWVVVLVLVLPH